MNREQRKYRKMSQSELTRSIMSQYILAIVGSALGTILFIFFSWAIFSSFTWYYESIIYRILQVIQSYILVLGPFTVMVEWIFITYYYFRKPMHYLDEVVEASKSISQSPEQMIELSKELNLVQNELNQIRQASIYNIRAAKEAEQRKNDLIVYLAHDLKTPLTSVIGYLTLLRDEPQISGEIRTKYTGVALDKAERLEALINEFFEVTRFNLTNISLDLETVNLSRMLEQLSFEFYPVLGEKNLKWDLHIIEGIELVCDPNKLERVFDNLIRNAINYSYANTTISLDLDIDSKSKEIIIKVKNKGKTIPPEKLKHIFEQFYRLDSSRGSNTGGAGLGLAIAKEIVELHHGEITVKSEEEAVEFTIVLPVERCEN